jgi:hypothetical protein
MRRLLMLVASIAASGCATLGMSRTLPENEREAVIQEVVEHLATSRKAMEQHDLELRLQLMAHEDDVVQIGTDEGEYAVGWKAIERLIRSQISAFPEMRFTIRSPRIGLSRDGTVAWYANLLDVQVLAGGQRVELKDLRETGVLEKRDGKWVTVQTHLSIGAPGQVAPYPILPASAANDYADLP